MPLYPRILFLVAVFFASSLNAQGRYPELPVSAPQLGPADGTQAGVSVATDGEIFLVAWFTDERIYAGRLTRDGELLDQISFRVSERRDFGDPHVAWSGQYFLVGYGSVIKRITRDGQIAGESRVDSGALMSLTCNFSQCLAVHQQFNPDPFRYVLRGTLLRPDGEIAFSAVELSGDPNRVPSVRAASNGSTFLVVWYLFNPNSQTEREVLYARTVTSSGLITGPTRRVAVGNGSLGFHDVASIGSEYLVAWVTGNPASAIDALRFRSDGQPVGDAFRIHTAPVGSTIRLRRYDAGYLMVIVNMERFSYEAYRIASTGSKVGTDPVAAIGGEIGHDFELAAAGDRTLVVTTAGAETNTYGFLIRPQVTQSILISRSARGQYEPAVAAGAGAVMVVWEELVPPENRSQIYLNNLNDVAGEVPVTPDTVNAYAPAISFGERHFLVTWLARTRSPGTITPVYATVVAPTGARAGEDQVVAANSCSDSRNAASGGRFLVTWRECNEKLQLHAALLGADGTVLARFPISPAVSQLNPGGVAGNGDEFLVTWSEGRAIPGSCDPIGCHKYFIMAARVSGDGEILQTIEIESHGIPEVAWDGSRYLLTWSDADAVMASRITASGDIETPRRFSTAGGGPLVAWDGSAFVATGVLRKRLGGESDVMFARVTHAQLDSGEGSQAFALAATEDHEHSPAIVALRPKTVAVVYQRLAHEPQYAGANRVFVQFVQFGPRARAVR